MRRITGKFTRQLQLNCWIWFIIYVSTFLSKSEMPVAWLSAGKIGCSRDERRETWVEYDQWDTDENATAF